jgi:hypothetical protein
MTKGGFGGGRGGGGTESDPGVQSRRNTNTHLLFQIAAGGDTTLSKKGGR